MSLIYQSNATVDLPTLTTMEAGLNLTSTTLDGTGETVFMTGNCYLEGGGGSKTISGAGGGSITWRTGPSVTFSSGSSNFEVGIQDASTATAPAQGDGTFDVKGAYTAASALASSTTYTTDMASGTKTITHGDVISIGLAMTTRNAPDSVQVASMPTPTTRNFPAVTTNTSGSYASVQVAPSAVITFDDSTKGWIYGSDLHTTQNTAVAVNVDTGTADEYGNIIIPKQPFLVTGARMMLDINLTANFEVILYSDPLGTPVAERTITFDAETSGTSALNQILFMFTTPFLMRANSTYCLAFRPTTTTNNSCYYCDGVEGAALLHAPNAQAYACRRIGNSGAFSDFNGGTAKTRIMQMVFVCNHLEQGVNNANYRIGI